MYMKKNLLLLMMAGLVVLATSCHKYVVEPNVPALTGTWYLQNAARYDAYKWQGIHTGYESGSFTFYSNGDAVYTDALGSLSGVWDMYPVTDGYYDWNGHYREGYHVVFALRLYEGNNSSPAVNWLFDDNDFNGGGRFRATYTTNNFTYEYTFARE
jgi:hypothetical protein